jgi:DNA-binding winged helix-turn-helix (wHTH) protein
VGQTSVSIPDQGVFVDDNSGRVYLDGKELDGISESMYRAFYILYNRRDQIISKDEFAAYVWDTDHYVGDDQRIYQLIRRTRKALGESARNPVYLETLPGRGFRLHSTPLRKGP